MRTDRSLLRDLDLRAYDILRIDACKAPVWRVFKCEAHGRWYDDLIGMMLPLTDENRKHLACGCLKPYNQSAFEYILTRSHES